MQRRQFLSAGVAASAGLAFSAVWSQATPALGTPTLPAVGWRRMTLGSVDIHALHDGVLRRPLGQEFVPQVPLDQVRALLASQGLPTEHIDVPFTAFLLVHGRQRVLLDTGFADNGPPTAGRLQGHLAAAGFKPEDITDVVLSHFHGDHIQGLRWRSGALVYPQARVHVPQPEHAFWTDPARIEAAPPAIRGAFDGVRRALGDLGGEQLQRFEPGVRLFGWLQTLPAYGHSPGHTLFSLESGGQKFAYLADITNVPALFARSPDWAVMFDMDPEQARQSRRRIFDMVVRERMLAGGYHFPFPAFGRIEPRDSGYEFKAVA